MKLIHVTTFNPDASFWAINYLAGVVISVGSNLDIPTSYWVNFKIDYSKLALHENSLTASLISLPIAIF